MSDRRLIYHFTHLRNLGQVIHDGALYADTLVRESNRLSVEVGDREVKRRRRSMQVTCGPGGCPSDYVPFYFAPRSPMLFKIHRGGVPQYQDGQKNLIYLVSDVDLVIASELQWVFTDGNCANSVTEYFENPTLLESSVDWPLMRAKFWNDTAEDPDRMRRRMAEFLVYQRFPLDMLIGIGAMTSNVAKEVETLLSSNGHSWPVRVRRDWYYD